MHVRGGLRGCNTVCQKLRSKWRRPRLLLLPQQTPRQWKRCRCPKYVTLCVLLCCLPHHFMLFTHARSGKSARAFRRSVHVGTCARRRALPPSARQGRSSREHREHVLRLSRTLAVAAPPWVATCRKAEDDRSIAHVLSYFSLSLSNIFFPINLWVFEGHHTHARATEPQSHARGLSMEHRRWHSHTSTGNTNAAEPSMRRW